MKTVFDLRITDAGAHANPAIIEALQKHFDEPLEVVNLGEGDITPCIGCWSCWLKTPGKCVFNDPMSENYPAYVNSDTVIFLLGTAQGFINHLAKAFLDRTIPHYHPYIELVTGECHHVARYPSYPDMLFYVETESFFNENLSDEGLVSEGPGNECVVQECLTNDEKAVIEDYLYRMAFHFKANPYRIHFIRAKDHKNVLQVKPLEPRKARNRALPFGSTKPMERLVIYNGSPRRTGSNSALILEGVVDALGERVDIRDLKETEAWEEWAAAFTGETHVMFFLPLYVHAMPSHVMAFMQKFQVSEGTLSFFVQSGFPESSQSHYLESYFEQLSLRLNRTYLGTAIKGNVEGLQMRPEKTREKMIAPMVQAVADLVEQGWFNQDQINRLAVPVRFGKVIQLLFNLMGHRLINGFWDGQLKANNAYEKRFDQPYLNEKRLLK